MRWCEPQMLELHTTCALAVWSGTLPEVVVPRWNYTGEPQLYCSSDSTELNERLTTKSVEISRAQSVLFPTLCQWLFLYNIRIYINVYM